MAFNAGQLTLRAALISDAQRNNRLDEVTNLIKATSIPELQPHLAEMFSQLADKTGSPDRKKTKAGEEEVIKMVCKDDDDDDDDSWADSSSPRDNHPRTSVYAIPIFRECGKRDKCGNLRLAS